MLVHNTLHVDGVKQLRLVTLKHHICLPFQLRIVSTESVVRFNEFLSRTHKMDIPITWMSDLVRYSCFIFVRNSSIDPAYTKFIGYNVSI
jgi:hypothetical protein